jgi:hypothetical protein
MSLRADQGGAFEIAFIDERFEEEGVAYQWLRLTADEFSETMVADLTTWSPHDYECHWMDQLNSLIHRSDRAALITSMHDPLRAFRVETWPMWRAGDDLFMQSRLLFMLEPAESFDPAKVHDYVGERQPYINEGDPSEWRIPLRAIEDFLRARRNSRQLNH